MKRFKARHHILLFSIVKTLDTVLVVVSISYRRAKAGAWCSNINYELVFQFRGVGRYSGIISAVRGAESRVFYLSESLVKCWLTRGISFIVQSPSIAVIGVSGIPLSDIRYGDVNNYTLNTAAVYIGKDSLSRLTYVINS